LAEKVGFLEYSSFHQSDVQDFASLIGNRALANQVTEVPVDGGTIVGAGESEVLLDIDTALGINQDPNTSYVVYDAPLTTSFQTLFNAMINDGDTIISNSWSQCEDETSLADAQSIDSVLEQAAASGISVINGTGDDGSTCLDGSPNVIGVPADSPHATAVGGSHVVLNADGSYAGETWWGASSGPLGPTGAGGFGVSKFFTSPGYQSNLSSSTMRSVPDLVMPADPTEGMVICQQDAGGCPSGSLFGGTSLAAPELAAYVATLDQTIGSNIGEINPALYPLAGTNSFHSATAMGTDFAHVGLGSINLSYLESALAHQSVGAVSPTASSVTAETDVPADGSSASVVHVELLDDHNYPVSGEAVSLVPRQATFARFTSSRSVLS
jgi:kumamolisin